MVAQILATKLYIPRLRPKIILRPCLIERLNEDLQRKLTLISAPRLGQDRPYQRMGRRLRTTRRLAASEREG